METEIPVFIKRLEDLQINHNYEFDLRENRGRKIIGKYAGKNYKGKLTFLFEDKYFFGVKSNIKLQTTKDRLKCNKGNIKYLGNIKNNNEVDFNELNFNFTKYFLEQIN